MPDMVFVPQISKSEGAIAPNFGSRRHNAATMLLLARIMVNDRLTGRFYADAG
jgi:hypothetical protein